MPHLTLEYSANLPEPADLPHLLTLLHSSLATLGISLDDCKTRVHRHTTYLVGTGAPDRAFVHLTLALLDRRPPDVHRAAGDHLLHLLQSGFPTTLDCDFTVEVRPMRSETYFKARSNP